MSEMQTLDETSVQIPMVDVTNVSLNATEHAAKNNTSKTVDVARQNTEAGKALRKLFGKKMQERLANRMY